MNARSITFLALLHLFTGEGGSAVAMDLYTYDLDSLVFMSEHIVRGRISTNVFGNVTPSRFLITETYLGSFKSGDTPQVAALEFFSKSTMVPSASHVRIGPGDELIGFLVRATNQFGFPIPADAVVYMPVPSGLRVIVENKVLGFTQWNNPGPYQMDGLGATSPPVDAFLKQCAEAIARVRPMINRLTNAPDRNQTGWLLDVLRGRTAVTNDWVRRSRDAIAEAACTKLAETGDLAALDEGLQYVKSWHDGILLNRGFASVKGREFLLQKLADPKLPLGGKERRSYATAYPPFFLRINWQPTRRIPNSRGWPAWRLISPNKGMRQHPIFSCPIFVLLP